jgi:hypothetical protein
VDPDVIAAAVLIIADMGDSAGRIARDCDRLAALLRSLLPDPFTGPTSGGGLVRLAEPPTIGEPE